MMQIRDYRTADAPALSALYRRSVEVLGPRHYDAAQIAAWAALTPMPDALAASRADGRRTLIAVDMSDEPLAFADLEANGHIHYFYCAPEAAGQGVAARLYLALEGLARQSGITRLHVEASEGARNFFSRQGFMLRERRDFEIGGIAIHNYAMEKPLP